MKCPICQTEKENIDSDVLKLIQDLEKKSRINANEILRLAYDKTLKENERLRELLSQVDRVWIPEYSPHHNEIIELLEA